MRPVKVKFEKVSSCVSPLPGTSNAEYYCHVMTNRTIGTIHKMKESGRYQFMPDYGQPYERMSAAKISELKSMIRAAVTEKAAA